MTDEALELLPAVRDGLERLECALFQVGQHRRAGPLQISLLASFLQMWLLPRVRYVSATAAMQACGTDLRKYPLLESDDEPWSVWQKPDEEVAWHSRAPGIDDSAGLLVAAEEGLGYAAARDFPGPHAPRPRG